MLAFHMARPTTPEYADVTGARMAARYPHRQPWGRTLLMLLLITAALSFIFCPGCALSSEQFRVTVAYNFCYTTGLWLANGYPTEWLNQPGGWVSRVADWKEQPLRRFLLTMVFSLVASLLVIVLVNGGFRVLYMHRPLREMLEPRVWTQFIIPLIITAVISLFLHSRAFLQNWREALVLNERLQKEMAQAEVEALRQQLDPHFMFNALNALTSLVEDEPKVAVRFIRQLSLVYRYVLDARGREVVSLQDELEFAESYLFLQRIRYGEALQVQMPAAAAVPPDAVVPPLSLQLLIENALKHNVATAAQPLQLRIELDETARHLRVVNSLRPRRVAPGESTGIGLPNLRGRYRHLTQEPVQVERGEAEFGVTLPVLALSGEMASW